jgi:hypothetical protein
MSGACSTYGERGEVHTGFWCGNLMERPLGRPRCRCEDNIKMYLQELDGEVWNGLIWLRIRTSGGLL